MYPEMNRNGANQSPSKCPVGTIPVETWTGPVWSTFATRTLNFELMNFRMYGIVVHQFRKKTVLVFFLII